MSSVGTTENLLDRIVTTLGDLPASPAIVSTVMGLTSNPDSKVVEISKVLSADQSLTAKVLRLSNSSFYGRPKEVKTLDEAILLLGFFTVRSIVIATSAHTMYTKESGRGPQAHLWEHSLATAVASRQLAVRLKHPEKDEIFISALLHDIGKLVLLQKLPEIYLEVLNRVEGEKASFIATESEQLGFTHCEVAAVLLDKWQFPSSLRRTICLHHDPPDAVEGEPIPAAHLICLGNHLAKRLGVGFSDARIDDLAATPSARLMGLDETALDEILEETREYYQVETNIFEES